MKEQTEMKRRGRPKKSDAKETLIKKQEDLEPCPSCVDGFIEVETEDENGDVILIREECEYCGGTGVRPVGPFERDDVTDEDISAIEKALGYTTKAWGFIDERAIIAAAANRMGSKPVPA